jgi:hypothetical protein
MLGIVNRRQKMRGMNTKKIEENGIWGGYHPGNKTKKL